MSSQDGVPVIHERVDSGRSWMLRFPLCLLVTYLVCLQCFPLVAAAQEPPRPEIEVTAVGELQLDYVLEGGLGIVHLVFYLQSRGPEEPTLVVRFVNRGNQQDAVAEVFDVPSDEDHIPVELRDGELSLPESLTPSVRLTAIGGWWRRDGVVNYDLDIDVYGPVMSMWAVDDLGTDDGPAGWQSLLGRGQPNARIVVRDVDDDGVPDWDWRTMLAEFPHRGDYRTTYAERRCNSSLTFDGGIIPQWPFIAGNDDYGYEQANGIFRPPIVVDWEAGRIRVFSEMVTLRNQSCTYGMHSISRVLPSKMNSPNFEVPFAFYDLSERRNGFPNLIIRAARTILEQDDGGLAAEQRDAIRYSWSNEEAPHGWMDYKVDVFGFHPYDFETPIAAGKATIDAPPYELFPGWVMSHAWPAVTFIDTEDLDYLTSEGIYESLDVGVDFLMGHTDDTDPSFSRDIREGLRAEFRLKENGCCELYLSPVDNRLHLAWAEGGVWRLNEEQIIRVSNLDEDKHVDLWSREVMTAVVQNEPGSQTEGETRVPAEDEGPGEPEVIEALYALPGHLLHLDGAGVTLVRAEYEPAVLETLPPTDHDTWEAHRAQLAPFEARRRDPKDLRAWLDAFPGPRSEIVGASVGNVRTLGDGFRFELTLEPRYRACDVHLLELDGLPAGSYLVQHCAGQFAVSPLMPAQLRLEVAQAGASPVARVTVRNTGGADVPGVTSVAETVARDGSVIELTRRPVDALAGETVQVLVHVASTVGDSVLHVRLEDAEGNIVAAASPTRLAVPHGRVAEGIFDLLQIPVIIPVPVLFSVLIALAAFLAFAVRREQGT